MTKPRSKEELIEGFRVETIQEAAMRVIARKGVAGASMQEIADEAGISKGTIYLYFENQKDLIERTVEFAISRLLAIQIEALESSGSHLERLERVIGTKMRFLESHLDLFRLCVVTKFPDGLDPAKARCKQVSQPQYQQYLSRLEKFLEEAMEAGEVKRAEPRRLAVVVDEAAMGLLFHRLSESEPRPLEVDLAWLMDLVLHGLSNNQDQRSKT